MTKLYYPPTQNAIQKTLGAALLTGVTASASLNNVTGIQNLAGVMVVDRIDANGTATPSKREYISFTGTSGSTVVTLLRGLAGSTDQDHAISAIVEFGADIIQQQSVVDNLLNVVTTAGALDTTKVVDLTTAQTLTNKVLTTPTVTTGVLNGAVTGTSLATASDVATGTSSTLVTTPLSVAQHANNSLYRQAIINGNFDIWQRGTSFTRNAAGGYGPDRWYLQAGVVATTWARQAVTDLYGSQYCVRCQRDSGTSGTGLLYLLHNLETVSTYPFRGKKVTVSFQIRKGANYSATSNLTTVTLNGGTGTDQNLNVSYAGQTTLVSATPTLTTSWQQVTMTTSAVLADTVNEMALRFDFTPTGTAGAADYFEITQVQLCAGDVALPFMPKSFPQELIDCQRYYQKSFPYATAPATATGSYVGAVCVVIQVAGVSKYAQAWVNFPTRLRIAPPIYNFYNPISANTTFYNRSIAADSGGSTVPYNEPGQNGMAASNVQVAADAVTHVTYVHYSVDSEL